MYSKRPLWSSLKPASMACPLVRVHPNLAAAADDGRPCWRRFRPCRCRWGNPRCESGVTHPRLIVRKYSGASWTMAGQVGCCKSKPPKSVTTSATGHPTDGPIAVRPTLWPSVFRHTRHCDGPEMPVRATSPRFGTPEVQSGNALDPQAPSLPNCASAIIQTPAQSFSVLMQGHGIGIPQAGLVAVIPQLNAQIHVPAAGLRVHPGTGRLRLHR